MKTAFVVYVLAFVSVILIYVSEHRGEAREAYSIPWEQVTPRPRLRPAPDDFATDSARPAPEMVTTPPPKGEGPAVSDVKGGADDPPQTLDSLNEKIEALSREAASQPNLNLDVSQLYLTKSKIYEAQMRELNLLEAGAGPQDRYKLDLKRQMLKGRRIKALWRAIEHLNKVPTNEVGDTDVRLCKAYVYAELPDQALRAVAELRKIAQDRTARPKFRAEAQKLLKQFEKERRLRK